VKKEFQLVIIDTLQQPLKKFPPKQFVYQFLSSENAPLLQQIKATHNQPKEISMRNQKSSGGRKSSGSSSGSSRGGSRSASGKSGSQSTRMGKSASSGRGQ
jgi:hypothetical protein